MTVSNPKSSVRRWYRRSLYRLRVEGLVPEGQIVVMRGRDVGDVTIELRPAAGGTSATASTPKGASRVAARKLGAEKPAIGKPAPVPDFARIARWHPALTATRDYWDAGAEGLEPVGVVRMRISKASYKRTLRILHRVFTEAQVRGMSIESAPPSQYGYRRERGVLIKTANSESEIVVREIFQRHEHELTKTEQRDRERGRGWGIPSGTSPQQAS